MEAIFIEASATLPQIAIVAKANVEKQKFNHARVYGNCLVINELYPNYLNSLDNALFPGQDLADATRDKSLRVLGDAATVKLLKQGDHGRVTFGKNYDSKYSAWFYTPEVGFKGKDRVTFEVELAGLTYRLEYFMHVVELGRNRDIKFIEACETRRFWKISQSDTFNSEDPTAWLRSAQLSALLATASQSLTDFQDLPGTAVGQTTGEGASAAITLDTTAAGHNWYIDPTPLDNIDDYLPTSNPNIWQAKAGTDAAGKMDMLSVLLHEYGHALGLEHSAQVGDFMSATLQPGQRRLPNADELARMSQLVAQIKASQADTAAQSDALADPSAPASPGNPLSMLGLLPLGFVRRNSAGNGAATGTVHTDYLTAIQPTLTNGSFATGLAQWESTGAVSTAGADAAHYTVTLSESSPTSAGQTHAGQAFVLGATDRFLSFTVSGLNLQSNSDAQDAAYNTAQDAFEVALLNANTGVSLLGGLGATHQQRTRQ